MTFCTVTVSILLSETSGLNPVGCKLLPGSLPPLPNAKVLPYSHTILTRATCFTRKALAALHQCDWGHGTSIHHQELGWGPPPCLRPWLSRHSPPVDHSQLPIGPFPQHLRSGTVGLRQRWRGGFEEQVSGSFVLWRMRATDDS